jgi:hypothetical protein
MSLSKVVGGLQISETCRLNCMKNDTRIKPKSKGIHFSNGLIVTTFNHHYAVVSFSRSVTACVYGFCNSAILFGPIRHYFCQSISSDKTLAYTWHTSNASPSRVTANGCQETNCKSSCKSRVLHSILTTLDADSQGLDGGKTNLQWEMAIRTAARIESYDFGASTIEVASWINSTSSFPRYLKGHLNISVRTCINDNFMHGQFPVVHEWGIHSDVVMKCSGN